MKIRRRSFIHRTAQGAMGASLALSVGSSKIVAHGPSAPAPRMEHQGIFIRECSLPGESRTDEVFPAHPNGLQVSRNRWLLIYATRGVRGGDDDRSIVYQLRQGTPDGAVIKEGMLAPCLNDWDPFHDGSRYIKQNGSPVAFGVPRGALIHGEAVPHSNLFVVKWRVVGLGFDQKTGTIIHDRELGRRTQGVEWMQIRLTPDENDVEIVQPARRMRQKGFETGNRFCPLDVAWMNQAFVQAIPFNSDATEWIDCNHFDRGWIAPLKHSFNSSLNRYEWTETGDFLFDRSVFEASVVRWKDEWLVAARHAKGAGGVAWVRTPDPFTGKVDPLYIGQPKTGVPRTLYVCADGVLRLFSGEGISSPYRDYRNPLFCWDVHPNDNFRMSNRRVVFDAVKAGFSTDAKLMVGMCKLLPPCGNRQLLVHRVAPRVYRPTLTPEGFADCGIYHAWLTYDQIDTAAVHAQSPWTFPEA